MTVQQDVRVAAVVIDDTTANAVADYSRLGTQIKALQKARDAARDAILDALGDAPEGIYNGTTRVALVDVARTNIDSETLKVAYPEAYAAVASQSTHKRIYPK